MLLISLMHNTLCQYHPIHLSESLWLFCGRIISSKMKVILHDEMCSCFYHLDLLCFLLYYDLSFSCSFSIVGFTLSSDPFLDQGHLCETIIHPVGSLRLTIILSPKPAISKHQPYHTFPQQHATGSIINVVDS